MVSDYNFTAFVDEKRLVKLRDEADKLQIKTNLNFLLSHNGLRPGKMHILMGTKGSGKSTLVRTMIMDLVNNLSILDSFFYWLTEESIDDAQVELSRSIPVNKFTRFDMYSDVNPHPEYDGNLDNFLVALKLHFKKSRTRVCIIDNITTAKWYPEGSISRQSIVVDKLKKFAIETGVALLIVAHTQTGVNDGSKALFDADNIRGLKRIGNVAEFFYAFQRFRLEGEIGEKFFTFINVLKHRGQELVSSYFQFNYDYEHRIYCYDGEIDMNKINAAFKDRARLKG